MANVAVGNRYGIQIFQAGYPSIGQSSFTLVSSTNQINLHSISAFNSGGSACDVGLSIVNATSTWKLYIGNVNNGTPTNKTSTIQAGSTVNIFDTTTNNGFMVECSKVFGYLTFNLSQAQSGSPVYSYQYWNGTSWATLNTNQVPASYGTGYNYVTFNHPVDWVKGDNGLGSNDGYAIRVRSTTAGGQAVQASSLRVGRWIAYRNSVATLNGLQAIFDQHPLLLDNSEALAPYFSTATSTNSIEAAYQQGG